MTSGRQTAIAIDRETLGLWLLISADVMFFTALVGSYVVLRFGGPPDSWPGAADVRLNLWLALLNVVVLTASATTVWLAARINQTNGTWKSPPNEKTRSSAAQLQVRKRWLAATIGLGGLFLLGQTFLLAEKWQQGIHPRSPRSLIHNQADLSYLAAMQTEIEQTGRSHSSDALVKVRTGLAGWTEAQIGRTDDPVLHRRLLNALAYQIYPEAFDANSAAEINDFLVNEQRELESELKSINGDLDNADRKLIQLQDKLRKSNGTSEPGNSNKTDNQSLVREAAEVTAKITELTGFRDRMVDRIAAQQVFLESDGGINHRFGLKLPMVIAGGNTWAGIYFLFMISHAVHVAGGIVVLVRQWWLRFDKTVEAVVTARFARSALWWQYVCMLWLVLFSILHLV